MEWNKLQLNLNTKIINITKNEIQNLEQEIINEKDEYFKIFKSKILEDIKIYNTRVEQGINSKETRISDIFGNKTDDILYDAFHNKYLTINNNDNLITYDVNITDSITKLLLRDAVNPINIYQYLDISKFENYKEDLNNFDVVSTIELNLLLDELKIDEYKFTQLVINNYDRNLVDNSELKELSVKENALMYSFPRLILSFLIYINNSRTEKEGFKFLCRDLDLSIEENEFNGLTVFKLFSKLCRSLGYEQSRRALVNIFNIFEENGEKPYIISFSHKGFIIKTKERNYKVENYLKTNKFQFSII